MAVSAKRDWDEILRTLSPAKRKVVKGFLREVGAGTWGTTKREILSAAKTVFGKDIDWDKILSILLLYLPVILSFLK